MKRQRKLWTSAQLKTMKNMARKKSHASRIAKMLKRSESAIRWKAYDIGLSLDSR